MIWSRVAVVAVVSAAVVVVVVAAAAAAAVHHMSLCGVLGFTVCPASLTSPPSPSPLPSTNFITKKQLKNNKLDHTTLHRTKFEQHSGTAFVLQKCYVRVIHHTSSHHDPRLRASLGGVL